MRRLPSTTALLLCALPLVGCDDPPSTAVASAPPPPEAPTAAPAPRVEEVARAEAPATATNGADDGAGVLKTVRFPGGELALPVAWLPKVRNEPPMTAVHVIPEPAMTCDLAVLEGHGTPRQAEEYLAAGANAYIGDTVRAPDIEVGGVAFQGIHVTKPKALPDSANALVEVYAAIAGDDLVGIGVTRLEQTPALEEGRRRCLQAFAQLTAKLPPPSTSPTR